MTRPGDCPHCHAPAPCVGETQHAWDCPTNGPLPRFDWDNQIGRGGPLADSAFTPLPPLATLTPDERRDLVRTARSIEYAQREARRAAA